MPVYGDLGTMPLTDVLQWIGVAQKTGVLEIERGDVRRRIEFTKGFIGGCHAGDQRSEFGQMLVARGMISEEQLKDATVQHELGGNRLGVILVRQGAMDEQEIRRMVTSHVEQTIQCLFEWGEGVFRFDEGATFDPVRVEVSLSVHDLLLRTLQHQDELKQIRGVLDSSGLVLRPTDLPLPPELTESEIAHRIFEALDGQKTVGEVVASVPASEILVLKLLHRVLTMGLVEIVATRPVPKGTATLLDPLVPGTGPHGEHLEPGSLDTAEGARPPVDGSLDAELRVTRRLIDRGEYLAAGALLAATSRAHPEDRRLDPLLAEVEAARRCEDLAG